MKLFSFSCLSHKRLETGSHYKNKTTIVQHLKAQDRKDQLQIETKGILQMLNSFRLWTIEVKNSWSVRLFRDVTREYLKSTRPLTKATVDSYLICDFNIGL